MLFCHLIFFQTLSHLNSLNPYQAQHFVEPYQAQHFVEPDLFLNCLERLSADDTSTGSERVELVSA